jgi:eukaryotic translation initiation factor 2C
MKRYEKQFTLITQGVKLSNVKKMVDGKGAQTMENIVNKTNVKLGGLNYSLGGRDKYVQLLFDDNLIIGIGVNHPVKGMFLSSDDASSGSSTADGSPPSVLGFSANYNGPFEFCGDFVYQPAGRDEKVSIIGDIVQRCYEYWQTRNGKHPKRIILYRNAADEGQFVSILRYEVPLLEGLLKEAQRPAKLTVIVPNRMHNLRFFLKDIPQGKPAQQNVKPGTVVDQQVVHPVQNEFYLSSHIPLQGTAKVPRYTVLYDANELSSDQLQTITYYLCYGHQIVSVPTSLPSPLYIANLYADRGRNIFNSLDGNVEEERALKEARLSELTDRLSYVKSELVAFRVNA